MKNKIVLAIAVIAVIATAALLLFSNRESFEAKVISVAVSEPKEGVNEVIVKLQPKGEDEPIYVKATSSTRVVNTSGNRFAVDYLREGDTVKVVIATGQKNEKIKHARRIVFIKGED